MGWAYSLVPPGWSNDPAAFARLRKYAARKKVKLILQFTADDARLSGAASRDRAFAGLAKQGIAGVRVHGFPMRPPKP